MSLQYVMAVVPCLVNSTPAGETGLASPVLATAQRMRTASLDCMVKLTMVDYLIDVMGCRTPVRRHTKPEQRRSFMKGI